MTPRRVYLAVCAAAVAVYLGALANGFVLDDVPIIVINPLIRDPSGLWEAFAAPYWGPEHGGSMYRPLAVATYWLDARAGGGTAWWFHLVNLLWHAGASAAVVTLARRWASLEAALIAGLIFAVHPVHVEAVANVVGRADVMAALFTCLAVHAALGEGRPVWSAVALVGGLLSKESAAVVPGLVAWGWVVGVGASRPSRRTVLRFAASWLVVGIAYGAFRWWVLHPFARLQEIAPLFVQQGPVPVRLTAVAALADVGRLLVFPLHLRADYSPAERTIVHSMLDLRFVLGLAVLAAWAALLVAAWRRRRLVETWGLGWIAIAFLPVANFLFPTGILVAERALYLPSVGLALAAGAWLARWPARRWGVVAGLVVVAGSARTVTRVPVWRSEERLTLSMLEDSPRSYVGPARAADHIERQGDLPRALEYLEIAIAQYDRDPRPFYSAADLAYTLSRPALADSMLARAERLCERCTGYYERRAGRARVRGDSATARWLVERGGTRP